MADEKDEDDGDEEEGDRRLPPLFRPAILVPAAAFINIDIEAFVSNA